MEAPLEEKPKDISHLFDTTDIGSGQEEKPKAKKRARSKPPVPVEAMRPRKRAAKKAAEPEAVAEAPQGEESKEALRMAREETDETKEALQMVRETSEEAQWEKAIEDAKRGLENQENDDAEWEAKISEAKGREAVVAKSQETAEPAFTEKEDAWFKQGEDEAHLKAAAERQEIEDIRMGLAADPEKYDAGRTDVIIDTQEEIDATVKRVEGMLKSGELNMDMFDVRDYEYLLTQQARLDRELETSGWWAARKLRSELKDIQKSLADYESQVESVERERADARDEARGVPSIPARKVQARMGSGTTLHKEGSGTSVHQDKKPGLFARLFGKK